MFSLTALGTRNPKSRWCQGRAPSEGAGEESVSGLCDPLTCGSLTPDFPVCKDTAAVRQGPTLLWSCPVLANYICDNLDSRYSPLVRCWGSGLQHAHLRGHSSAPNDAPKWWFRGLRLSLAALRSTESPLRETSVRRSLISGAEAPSSLWCVLTLP